MILTKKQEEGLKIAIARYKENKPYTCIAGYAGTGKSTLIQFIIAALGLSPTKDVAYVTFTGKAAAVLTQKGCPNAKTAHKLLYHAKPLPNGKCIFKPKRVLEDSYKLIIVDEVSMLPKSLWNLLLSHKIHVIACGDPEQLPPIDKNDTHNVLDEPHIFLDEIMRQAAESEIIQTSMKVRAGEALHKFDGQEVKIYRPYQLTPAMYQWADQILCATNQTRNKINHMVRKMAGKPNEPTVGDKVIGLRNHWDNISENGNALTNGQIGVLSENFHIEEYTYPPYVTNKKVKVLITDIITDDGDIFYDIPIDYQALTTGEKALTPEEEYRAIKLDLPAPYEFAYGYAITTWKAQGSEWDKVLFFEENFPYAKEEHRKYLYTGITRASKKLVVITK